jgi:hypothetical protein
VKVSNKYQFVNENAHKILMPIINNQKILRYISYLDNDPLNTNKDDISSTNIIYDGVHTENARIYLDLYNKSINNTNKILLFFSPIGCGTDNNYSINTTSHESLFKLNIVVPAKYWTIPDKQNKKIFRAYTIANEIAKEIDNRNIAGIGNVYIKNDRVITSDNNRILELLIHVENAVFTNG